jgi:hypothetical protein
MELHSLVVAGFSLPFSVSASTCEEIASIRRKFQRIGTAHILVLDETHKRVGDVDNYTIVLPGESPYIETEETSKYAAKYDMIACCNGERVLPPMIYSPSERGAGITTADLLQYVRNLLAQAAGALDMYPLYLLVDRATIHNEAQLLQEFHDWGCQDLVKVVKIPTAAAKRLSPLDNALFNIWRQLVLADGPLTKVNICRRMSDAWNRIAAEQIKPQYKKCGLMRHQDPYFDCPLPLQHRHAR